MLGSTGWNKESERGVRSHDHFSLRHIQKALCSAFHIDMYLIIKILYLSKQNEFFLLCNYFTWKLAVRLFLSSCHAVFLKSRPQSLTSFMSITEDYFHIVFE